MKKKHERYARSTPDITPALPSRTFLAIELATSNYPFIARTVQIPYQTAGKTRLLWIMDKGKISIFRHTFWLLTGIRVKEVIKVQ